MSGAKALNKYIADWSKPIFFNISLSLVRHRPRVGPMLATGMESF